MYKLLACLVAGCSIALPAGLARAASGSCIFDSCSKGAPTRVSASGTERGSYVIEFVHANGALQQVEAPGASPTDIYAWTWTPACETNNWGFVQQCVSVLGTCPIRGDSKYWIYYRNLSLTPPDGWHRLINTYCLGPQPASNLGGIQAQVQREFRNLPLPVGTIRLQPPTTAVVNLPVIAYIDTPTTKTFSVTALGATVTLTARPRSWTWHWGNAETVTTGPGAPYPTCQGPSPTCAAYTYHAPGNYGPITVSISWGATYRVNGYSQTFTVTNPVVVTAIGPPLTVADAPPVLVYGNG